MKAYGRCAPLVVASLILGTSTAVMADPRSELDPYSYIQPPKAKTSAKGSKHEPQAAPQAPAAELEETSTTTFVTMPADAPRKKGGIPGAGLLSGVKKAGGIFGGNKKNDPGKVADETLAQTSETSKDTSKVANKGNSLTTGVTHGTKKVTEGVASGTKKVGDGIASGTRKVGDGIASSAAAGGGVLKKGAHALSEGIKSTGAKMKDGSEAVGSKVAAFPRAISHGFKATSDKVKDGTGALSDKLAFKKEPKLTNDQPKPHGKEIKVGEPLVASKKETKLTNDPDPKQKETKVGERIVAKKEHKLPFSIAKKQPDQLAGLKVRPWPMTEVQSQTAAKPLTLDGRPSAPATPSSPSAAPVIATKPAAQKVHHSGLMSKFNIFGHSDQKTAGTSNTVPQ